jgi:hypothetical protein
MALEIVKEGGPVGLEAMHLEIPQGERETVIDPDQRRHVLSQPLDQPFDDSASGPVFARRWGRRHLDRRHVALGQVNAQALQARIRRLSARIVDADFSGKRGHFRGRADHPTNMPSSGTGRNRSQTHSVRNIGGRS